MEKLWRLRCPDQVSDTTWQEGQWRHILFFPRGLCLLEGTEMPVQPFRSHPFGQDVRFFDLVVVLLSCHLEAAFL